MLDIKFVRDNPDAVKENIKKKFQDAKLPLVDEVIEKDAKYRECLKEVESLKAARNKLSKANGPLFGQLKKCDDEAKKAELQAQIDANNAAVKADADKMAELEAEEAKLAERIQEIMYTIPQMIDPSVPIGPDDTYNVEAQRFGEPVVPDFPIPYHTEIMESFDGIDMDAAGACRQWLLLSAGQHRPPARGCSGLCPRLHDRQGFHLCHPSLHDARQRGAGRHVLP